MERCFVDTSFLIALASATDRHHERAAHLLDEVEIHGTALVTTDAVLLELGGALSRIAHRAAAVTIIRELRADSRIEVVPMEDSLLDLALELFAARNDKEWSLTDCVSFVAMQARGITRALTADMDFEQAGFVAMMRS